MGFKDPPNRSLQVVAGGRERGLKEGAERSCARCQSERDARNEAGENPGEIRTRSCWERVQIIGDRRGVVEGRTYCEESSCALSWLAEIVLVGPSLTPQMWKLNTGAPLLCPLYRNLGRPGDQIRCSFPLLCSFICEH
ncbi:hypothetical protein SETIT_5G148700v2 [Setaria italica]|uniref:Uncharacterized protein n=1 Tax=Setaria italica TaxID=4555 RepID=A0A368R4V1_SETIT|nr:hypothetical protein SETIT_5G148700v2 [Setaria italica]